MAKTPEEKAAEAAEIAAKKAADDQLSLDRKKPDDQGAEDQGTGEETEVEKLRRELAEAKSELEAAKRVQPSLPPVPEGALPVETEAKKSYTVNPPPEGTTAWLHNGLHYTAGQKIEADSTLAKQLAAAKIISL